MAEQPFELIFSDANNKDIEKVQVKTNSYGTFQGSFIIPMGKLNGRMQLKTKFGSISVRGKAIAFSGFYISGAKVKYLVYKTIAPNYRSIYGNTMPEQIAQGFTETNARGEFSVKFFAADQNAGLVNYSYKLSAEITDINGETQIAHKMINAGKKDLILNVVLPDQLFLSLKNDSLIFNVHNLNGEPIKARLQSEWSLLKAPDRIIIRNPFSSKPEKYSFNKADFLKAFPNEEYENDGEPQNWPIAKMALRQDILAEAGKGQMFLNSKSLSAGYYKVKFLAINSNDDTVSIEKLKFKTLMLLLPGLGWAALAIF